MCFFKKKKLKKEAEEKAALAKAQEAKLAAEVKKTAEAEKKAEALKAAEEKNAAELKANEEKKFAELKAAEEKKAAELKVAEEMKTAELKAEEERKLAEAQKEQEAQVAATKIEEKPVVKAKKPAAKTAEAKPAKAENISDAADRKTIKGKVEIFLDKDERFRFRLKAANGITIARSESYSTKAGCKKGFSSIQNYENIEIVDISDENTAYLPKIGQPVFEIYKDNGGEFRFRYRSGNAIAVLFCTGGYTTKASCINSVKSVIKNSCNFEIVDITKEKKVIDDED